MNKPIVDRSGANLPDPVIVVILGDGYKERFWKTDLSDSEYIRRAKILRNSETNS